MKRKEPGRVLAAAFCLVTAAVIALEVWLTDDIPRDAVPYALGAMSIALLMGLMFAFKKVEWPARRSRSEDPR